jgi:hypothetical protein
MSTQTRPTASRDSAGRSAAKAGLRRGALAVASAFSLVAGLLTTSGCGVEEPLSPSVDDAGPSPWIGDLSREGASLRQGREDHGGGRPPWAQAPVHAEIPIDPAIGGRLHSGRHTLDVPPGALPWTVPFTMDYYNHGVVSVELGPDGAHFAVPLTLSIDLHGTTALPTDDITLYWWDEANGVWVDVGGTWDPSTMTLTTQLDHFSCYRPGRAGW